MLTALSPYLIPPVLQGRKIQNIGDGFILRAIERRLGSFGDSNIFSPRATPGASEFVQLETSDGVVLAGANQLRDDYTIWPGLTAEALRASRLRPIPFGIGYHGEEGFTDGMSAETKEILRIVHERIEYSSWRCPVTVAYLNEHLPELAGQILMTGCPVTYDAPLLDGQKFESSTNRIAVTPTERADFWARETAIIDFVAKEFPASERLLVLHQNYSPVRGREALGSWVPTALLGLNAYERLRRYASDRGFKIVVPADADEAIRFYGTVDLHVGTRLHAHLLCLSQARRSFLVAVDGRATGMAAFLGFPLADPNALGAVMSFDFELVRENARRTFATMQKFLGSVK